MAYQEWKRINDRLEVLDVKCHSLQANVQHLRQQNKKLQQEVDTLKSYGPDAAFIADSRAHASKERIRDLEAQLKHNDIEPQ